MENGPLNIKLATPKASVVRVYRNPTPEEFNKIFASFRAVFPDAHTDEKIVRCAFDDDDNRYVWRADTATHEMISERLRDLYNIDAKQTNEAELSSRISAHIFKL